MLISLIVNCDTRTGFEYDMTKAESTFNGCVSNDFLIDGVINKIKFFQGFEIEVILFVDEHVKVPPETLQRMNDLADTLVVRKHTDEHAFNDYNYLKALSLANGDIVCHCDQDTACFTSSPVYVQNLINLLEQYKFISYPSYWSPYPVHDESFGGLFWASTRFFICKRETLKLDELAKCIDNPEWMYEKYGDSPRRVNWTEHYLAKINGNSVYYPPLDTSNYTIFSWGTYRKGTLDKLNKLPYEEIEKYIIACGGLHYPVDLDAIPL